MIGSTGPRRIGTIRGGGGRSLETPETPAGSPTVPAPLESPTVPLESESVDIASAAKELGKGGGRRSGGGPGGGRWSQSAKTGPPLQTESMRAGGAGIKLWSRARRAYHSSGAEGAAAADDLNAADLRNASADLSVPDVEAFQASNFLVNWSWERRPDPNPVLHEKQKVEA